ncbi:MAG: hypothetical protein V1678_03030 [Candidatus Aenigmatarchaeota archaeon]
MKGIELPINILVVVAIAVIVLLGLVALYFVGFNPFSNSTSLTALKNKACSDFLLNYNCGKINGKTTSDVTLDSNNFGFSPNTLYGLCTSNKGLGISATVPADAEKDCAAACGC